MRLAGWSILVGAFAAGLVTLFVLPEADAQATMVGEFQSRFPVDKLENGAAWVSGRAYIFGGGPNANKTEIWRFDPYNDTLTKMAATLPEGRWAIPAAASGGSVYIFGSNTGSSVPRATIWRYEVSSDTLTVLSATLPVPIHGGKAVAVGGTIYVFPYCSTGMASCPLVAFTVATQQVQSLQPGINGWGAAAVTPYGIYYFDQSGTIYLFDQVAGALVPQPGAVAWSGYGDAVWDGQRVLLAGGGPATTAVRWFDPATAQTGTAPFFLPTASFGVTTVSEAGGLVIGGGANSASGYVGDRIYCFCQPPTIPICTASPATVAPGQAVNLTATAGSGVFSWSAPGGTPDSGTGSTFYTSFATTGTKTITVASGAARTCTVQVMDPVSCSNPAHAATNQAVTFTAAGGAGAFSWSAPGGAPSGGTASTFTTTYTTAGSKTVTVTAGPSTSCLVSVWDPLTCSAAPNPAATGQSVTATATGGSGLYSWSAPDGLPASANGTSMASAFATQGTKTFTVTAGLTATCVAQVWPPLSCSASPSPAATGTAVAWTATGGSGAFTWSMPSGSPSTGAGPSVATTYAMPGAKAATVLAGLSATCGLAVWAPITCSVTPSPAVTGLPAFATGTGGNGTYSWTAPAGTPSAGTGATFATTFASPGTKTIDVGGGLAGSCSVTVHLPPSCAGADSAWPGQAVQLSAHGGSGAYTWTAPAGQPAAGAGPAFTTAFSSAGLHVVTLASGGHFATCLIDVLQPPPPKSLPYPDPIRLGTVPTASPPTPRWTATCAPDWVTLDARGSDDVDGLVTQWSWEFGEWQSDEAVVTIPAGDVVPGILTVLDDAGNEVRDIIQVPACETNEPPAPDEPAPEAVQGDLAQGDLAQSPAAPPPSPAAAPRPSNPSQTAPAPSKDTPPEAGSIPASRDPNLQVPSDARPPAWSWMLLAVTFVGLVLAVAWHRGGTGKPKPEG